MTARPGGLGPGAIEGVDLVEAERLLGDRALLEKLLGVFVATWSDGAVRVRGALDAGDRAGAADVAHAARGVAANLAVHRVRDTAARLERILRDEPDDDAREALSAFEAALDHAIEGIRDALGEETK